MVSFSDPRRYLKVSKLMFTQGMHAIQEYKTTVFLEDSIESILLLFVNKFSV